VNDLISIIIPCHNSAHTIGVCLQAILQSDYPHYEIIVVDDCSTDNTRHIIGDYPCRLIALPQHRGAGYARNVGARASRGNILFFTDADCVLQKTTLRTVAETMTTIGDNVMIGGTYTEQPYDRDFFSRFQSLFIRYAETKHIQNPDYIATHALAMPAVLFHQHDGFNNHEFPILEDVEYSHRLKRSGVKLIMNPELQVQHMFNFSFLRSMRNAVRKTRFWTSYILSNQNLLADSGTASHELKFNTMSFAVTILLLLLYTFSGNYLFPGLFGALLLVNLSLNFKFLASIYRVQGFVFTLTATCYYLFVYPIAVSTGSALGISSYIKQRYMATEIT